MDPTSNWHDLFQRLSKEITVTPLSPSHGCDHNHVESEYFNHVVNPSKISQRVAENVKPFDSTGASVMSLPLVFPLDPPPGTFGMQMQTVEKRYHSMAENPTSFLNSHAAIANSSLQQPIAQSVHALKEEKNGNKQVTENRSAPRANVYLSQDGKTMFGCTKCGLPFDSAVSFQEHWKTHNSERPYVCDECGMALKRKEHLDRHRSAHTSERPHQCPQCDKKFKRFEHLTRHIITHAEVKPFICPLCGKGFSRKDHLTKHSATHCLRQETEEEQRRYFAELQSWDHTVVQKLGLDHNPVLKEFQEIINSEKSTSGGEHDLTNVKLEVDA